MKQHLLIILSILFLTATTKAQSPGIIIRPVGGIGATPLNPNGDGFSSLTSSGYITSDLTQSEVQYKVVATPFLEPVADLLHGPSALYSDLVRHTDGTGFFVYNDGTNLLFRVRAGNVVAGAKGYSVLLDTDAKFGSIGVNADANFQAATNGVNGNPGFELEVVLETNSRVAIYNVDGTSTPVLITSYPVNTHSQISVALSTNNNTPDYFYDFYVPTSALGITGSTPLRMSATTVMSANAAIGGTKSDIFGVDATLNYMLGWEAVINSQPIFTLPNLTGGGSGTGLLCTAAPSISVNIQAGPSVTVSGNWTRLDATKPLTATITLYKNGVAAGTTTATSGSTWNIAGVALNAGDILYAQAQATGESNCLQSASITVALCLPINISVNTGLTAICSSTRGFEGIRVPGTSVKIYQVTPSGTTLFADDATTTYHVTYPTAATWRYDGQFGTGSPSACVFGAVDVPTGSYMFTVVEVGKCESPGIFNCVSGIATAIPTVLQTILTAGGGSTISGTAAVGATVNLYRNGKLEATTTATAGLYAFLNLSFLNGDVVSVVAQAAGQCISPLVTRTVSCITSPPIILADLLGNLSTSISSIGGISLEASGSIVTVLENGSIVGTATVQANGTWSLNFTPVATRIYTATQVSAAGCGVSLPSLGAIALLPTLACPTITGTYNSAAAAISGTVPALFTGTVRLYQDGVNIGSAAVVAGSPWSINVNTTATNRLYPGGVLTVTAQGVGLAENHGCVSTVTIGCLLPALPILASASANIHIGETASFSVTNSASAYLYTMTDVPVGTTNYATSKFGVNGSLSLPTYAFNTAGTYNVLVKAVSLDGPGCQVSAPASILVTAIGLPVTLLYFKGDIENNKAQLKWATSSEQNTSHFNVERSDDGARFYTIGRVSAAGNSNTDKQYGFTDQQSINQAAYYRLKMVDRDDKFNTSSTVRLSITNKSLQVLSVLPNPFENDLQLNIVSDKAQSLTVQLVDLTGREVARVSKQVTAGTNNVVLSSLSNLSKGLYVLRVMNNQEELFTKRVNKVR